MGEKGLGKGFEAIFGADAGGDEEVLTLPISKVEPRQDQPRQNFDAEALEELADSLREYGLIQPITVRRLPSGYYQIIAGERRWRAARLAGLKEVPVRVLKADDGRAMEMALVENLQREDLNPIEEAKGYRTLMSEYGLTQEQTAQRVGKSRPAVTNAMRLLSLSPEVLKLVEEGRLSAGHARAILAISVPAAQLSVAQKVMELGMSVRQTEALAARVERSFAEEKPAAEDKSLHVDYVAELENSLTKALGRRVKVHTGRKKGRIELEYYGNDDLQQLIDALELLARAKGGAKNGQ